MTYDAMLAEQKSKSKGSHLYKAETSALNEESISDVVSRAADELTAVAEGRQRISLTDTPTLKAISLQYVKACAAAGTLPTMTGLARSLGCTLRATEDFRARNPNTESGKWLQMFHDTCSECLETSAMRGAVNTIMAIFISKARYGLKEGNELVIKANDPLGAKVSPEEIASRYDYLLDTVQEFDEVP